MTPMIGSAVLCAVIATTSYPTAGFADNLVVGQATLDLDKDGKTDRAVLVRNPDASVDLYIYLGTGSDTPTALRKPTIFKSDIASGAAAGIVSGPKGELAIKYGCGGCSNDTDTELRLTYRQGQVLVGGYTLNWDTRSGVGSCEVDFLTGRGFVGHGVSNGGRQIKVRSGPIALSSWSDDIITNTCP